MPVSIIKAHSVLEYFYSHGEPATIKKFNIKSSTIERYKRILNLEKKPRHAKILLLDIETFPIVGYVWDIWKQNLAPCQIIKDRAMISWSAKWLFSPDILSDCVTPDEALIRDDKRISKSIWDLMNDADVTIAHNGNAFDTKMLNTRFLINHMNPPSPYQVIDTLLQARSQFNFTSNKLDFIGTILENQKKLQTDFSLWEMCDNGRQDALNYMVKYNKYDITLLENAYLHLRPWMKSHPNMGLLMEADEMVCGICGSSDLTEIEHCTYNTMVGSYTAYRCGECGSTPHAKNNQICKNKRDVLLRNSAR